MRIVLNRKGDLEARISREGAGNVSKVISIQVDGECGGVMFKATQRIVRKLPLA